ncbi:MAG: hypothetical protein E6G50_09440 [Actinobacteria bacterium]|nr:MAG: hypothetical protein E6G50_09440 [Actinomycetota bacterium]
MSGPPVSARGTGDRGTDNRLSSSAGRPAPSDLTAVQREFLRKLKARMDGAPEKEIADFVQKLIKHPSDLWDCLQAFMTVSAKYGIEHKSMYVYWGVTSLALVWCDPYYALEFEYRSRPEAQSEWSRRFAALPANWHDEAVASIAKQRKKAKPLDFKRLDRFKEIEEDVEAAKPTKATSEKTPASKEAKRFVDAFHKYMTTKTKAARVDLDRVIESLKGRPLEESLHAYLDASKRYPAEDEWSLYVFFGLSSRAMHWCSGYFALKFQAWIKPETKSDWATRFASLSSRQVSELAKDFAYANKHTRILDELRFAYYRTNNKDPDDRALRNFDAVTNEQLRAEVSGALAGYDRDCEAKDLHGFKFWWDHFDTLLADQDRLTLAMVVKWCRDWFAADKVMRDELYWNACGALFARLLLDRPEEYKNGFNAEETAYFVSANAARHPYVDDFARRLRYLWTTRNAARFRQFCKVHAALLLYGTKRNMRLATMHETEVIYGEVEAADLHGFAETDIVTVPVTQREGLLKDRDATVSVGQTYGDLTIVWFRGMETAYVECRGLEKVLFVIYETDYAHQLGDLTTAHFYDAVYEGTEGLLVLIPAFFQILSYLPDLVSGGLSGLVKSIVVQYVINEGTEAVLGDGPEAQAVAMSLSIATGHWTQGESTATRNIAAELRASEALEHGALSTRGLPAHGEHVSVGHVAEQPQALGTGELATVELHPVAPQEHAAPPSLQEHRAPSVADAHERRPQVQAEHDDLKGKPPETKRPRKHDKLAAQETAEEHDLLAAEQKAKSPKGKPPSGRPKRTDDPVKSMPARSQTTTKPTATERGVRGERGTANKGTPRRPPLPPIPTAVRDVNPHVWYATAPFLASGVRYRLVGTGASFLAVESRTATRFQVYEIRNRFGRTVYVGITGGKTLPKNALDRLRQHLYTKQGEFIENARELHILGVDLDERIARGFEDDLIDEKKPYWNNRERDPESYVRKYGERPSIDEVRTAHNANLAFRIELLP